MKTLTKSRFGVALECPTKLRYTGKKEYVSNKQDNEFLQALAEGGFQVGELAKQYYHEGIPVDELGYDKALSITNKLLERENVTIFEAAILFDDRFFIRVDILKKVGNKVELIEVKAKSFDSDNPEFYYKSEKLSNYIRPGWRPYLFDVAFQTWVMEHAFPEWQVKPYLMMAEKNKTTTVDDLNQHFRIRRNKKKKERKECYTHPEGVKINVGEDILKKENVRSLVKQIWAGEAVPPKDRTVEDFKEFESRIYEYTKYYNKPGDIYLQGVGKHCKDCEFHKDEKHPEMKSGFEECWKSEKGENFDVNEPHIFNIWHKPKVKEFLQDNIYYQKDVEIEKYLMKRLKSGQLEYSGSRSPRQALQIEKVQNNDISEDIQDELFDKMADWKFPLHFIDFETNMMAIPFNAGRKPYEQIAFQFSCHTYYEDGTIIHDEWVNAEQGKFPNYQFVRALKSVLDKDEGSVFRFADHENTVLNQVRNQMLDEADNSLQDIIDWIPTIAVVNKEEPPPKRNMVDMLKLVQKHYYQKDMGGSNSIKQVLPTVLTHSEFLKDKYSKALGYGTHLIGKTIWQKKDGKVQDPYKQLPPIYEDLDQTQDSYLDEKGNIRDGGAALMAYSYLQFSDLDEERRQAITKGLLRYCELDTLAMVMIYEHWNSLK
jgi:hypothetical protein